MTANKPIVIAGGGTGGHVYPALAIADALVDLGIDKEDIRFVGSRRGIEKTVVPAVGYQIELLSGRGIKRKPSIDNFGAVCGLLAAMVRAKWLLWKWKPRAVVSVGGYAAFPCVYAATVLRIPIVLAESNAVPGAVNRLAGKVAKAAAVSYPNTPLPNATVTGNPVRTEIKNVKRDATSQKAAKEKLGVDPGRVLIGVFGGSLGARSINRAASELAAQWSSRKDISIFHVVGQRDWPLAETPTDGLQLQRVEYENHMDVLYSAADVLVCRSGATTSAELAVAGVPSVLVPLPGAPGDHQTANAQALAKAGGAVVLADADCSGPSLATALEPIIDDAGKRIEMGTAARNLGHPDAATKVAELVLQHSR